MAVVIAAYGKRTRKFLKSEGFRKDIVAYAGYVVHPAICSIFREQFHSAENGAKSTSIALWFCIQWVQSVVLSGVGHWLPY
jgi:hypothetical protein